MIRHINATAAKVPSRIEMFQEREHLVVPIVALKEGVLQAANAPAPEFVSAKEFSKVPKGWNGRPIFLGHPKKDDGQPGPGNTPARLQNDTIGIVFNAEIGNDRLLMEAWLDIEKTQERAPELLTRLEEHEPIDVSVGAFVETTDKGGTFEGSEFKGEWRNIVPDHLAILVDQRGACNWDMGCGVRAALGKEQGMNKKEKVGLFERVMSIFRSSELIDTDLRQALSEAIAEVEGRSVWVEAFKGEAKLVFYSLMPDEVLFEGASHFSSDVFQRTYVQADDRVTVGDDREQVSRKVDFILKEAEGAPAPGTTSAPKERTMAREKAQLDGLIEKSGGLFTEDDRGMLDGLTDDQVARFDKQFGEPSSGDATGTSDAGDVTGTGTPAAAAAAGTPPAKVTPPAASADGAAEPAAASTPATLEEYVAAAPRELQDVLNEGVRVGKERRAASIKSLTDSGRCDVPLTVLEEMPQHRLDQLTKLADVRVAVDYSGQAPAEPDADNDGAPDAPDLVGAMRTARGIDTK